MSNRATEICEKGKKLYLDKKYKEALTEFSSIELDVLGSFDESLIHHFKALCYSHMMEIKKSEEEFRLAIKNRPNYSKIQLDMGMNYYFFYERNKLIEFMLRKLNKKNNLEKALKCFEDGLIIDETNADIWYYRGYMLELLGKKKEARKSFFQSIELNKKIKNNEQSKLFETLFKKQ
jgi:tetratricopeptide (TPR) repeat protein